MSRLRADQEPPADLWLGKVDNEWPIHAFTSEHQVIAFLESAKTGQPRRAWKLGSYELGSPLTVIRNQPILAEVNEA